MGSYCTGGRGGAFLCSIRNSCTRNTGTNAKITFLSNDSRYPKCLLEGSPASPALTYDNSSIKKTTSVDHRSSDIERWKPIYSEKKKICTSPTLSNNNGQSNTLLETHLKEANRKTKDTMGG